MLRVVITLLAAVVVLGQSVPEAAVPENAALLEAISKAFERIPDVPVTEANEDKTLEVQAEPLEIENLNVEAATDPNTIVDSLLTIVNVLITSDHMAIKQKIAVGSLKLDDCFVDGLQSSGKIQRNGNAKMKNATVLWTALNINRIAMECHWEMLIYDGFITLDTDRIDFELEANYTGNILTTKVMDFKIPNFDDVAVTFTGMVTLNEMIQNAIQSGINGKKGAIEKALADAVMKLLG